MSGQPRDEQRPGAARQLASAASNAGNGLSAPDFISPILAGLFLGLGFDWWLGTRPVVTIVGIILGSVTGFLNLWRASAVIEELAAGRHRD